jgi:hypothetical protein
MFPNCEHFIKSEVRCQGECHLLGCYAVWIMWVIRKATRRNISEDGILHSHCLENLKAYLCYQG